MAMKIGKKKQHASAQPVQRFAAPGRARDDRLYYADDIYPHGNQDNRSYVDSTVDVNGNVTPNGKVNPAGS